ncbi:MAG: hypothetical protein E6I07_13170 [Chloroflexi bacterium]|nr:MAG: hypothetical protein E6I07_13170 [Chloroflexota bacterium]
MNRPLAGFAISGSLVLAACGRATGALSTATPVSSLRPASSLTVTHPLPTQDLVAAGLTRVADLVTSFDISATDGGRAITLIAAYADPARTVLVFRESPDMGVPSVEVNDDQGWINSSTSGGPVRGPGYSGDYYFALDDGPHSGADGLAHLRIGISGLSRWTPAGGHVDGHWDFTIALKVAPGLALAAPAQFKVGAWTVKIETLELTPSVVHLQAVVSGAAPDELSGPGVKYSFLDLLDAGGNPVKVVAAGAGVTVPKQQLNASNYRNSRINYQWARPDAGSYRLRFQGGGGVFTLPLSIQPT